jgi:pimeloyl-ACP methyl ester carboxylesterase
MSLALVAAVPLALVAGGSRPPAPAPGRAEKKIDAGVFAITVAGRRAGRESFEIVETGGALEVRTRSTIALPAGPTTIRGTLHADLDWKPRGGTLDTTTRGRTVRVTLRPTEKGVEAATELPWRSSISFTRPPVEPDLYFGANVIAHLTPLCRETSAKEKTLTAFPAAPLKIAPSSVRRYPLTKLGTPELQLTDVVADLAQSMRIEVVCDGSKLVAARLSNLGLIAVRASYEELASVLEGRGRGKPILSTTLVELRRKVHSGDATLGCTLLVPETHAEMKRGRPGAVASRVPAVSPGGLTLMPPRPAPLPAALLLGGFGAQDRDGNSVGPGDSHLFFLAVLAAKLGEAGVVTLRCDDRGTGQSTGDSRRVTLDTLARDARAGLAALQHEPAVDPTRVVIIGHSEGAIVAPMVAARSAGMRALALLAPPGRPLDAIIIDQQRSSMRRFGLSQAEIDTNVAELRATYDAVRAGKRLPTSLSPAERRGITESTPWLRSHFRHAPLAEAAALSRIPVLVTAGGHDVQIATADAEITRDAFLEGGNKLVSYKMYPALNNLFAASKSGSVADYFDPLSRVDPSFLEDLADFVVKATAPAPTTTAAQAQPPREPR